jgi:arginyl-tRNA synthetase
MTRWPDDPMNQFLLDSHCHLDFKHFDKDREAVMNRARDAGVVMMINSGIDLSTNRKSLELAKKQSQENPVYYVQYAHARIASIMRLAQERQINFDDGDVSLLTIQPEMTLIRRLLQFPEIIEVVTATLEPHHLAYYAQDLATIFSMFYKDCRVVTDDEAMTKARLKLVKATQILLVKTLSLMGMNAPDKM